MYTQRKPFSLVSSIFDPLGLLSPLAIRIKMILQQIWKLGKKWDELTPLELQNALQKVLNSYFAMPEIRLPRTVHDLSKNQPANFRFLWMPQWQVWQLFLTSVPQIAKLVIKKPLSSSESAKSLPLNK